MKFFDLKWLDESSDWQELGIGHRYGYLVFEYVIGLIVMVVIALVFMGFAPAILVAPVIVAGWARAVRYVRTRYVRGVLVFARTRALK